MGRRRSAVKDVVDIGSVWNDDLGKVVTFQCFIEFSLISARFTKFVSEGVVDESLNFTGLG